VAARQNRLLRATEAVLAAMADDVRLGLRETVGIESRLVFDRRYAVEIDLPKDTDVERIARAIDLENLEAWCEQGKVRIAIGPWYTTKDVDQVVLCVTKVVHVLLGLHAAPPKPGFWHRVAASASDVLALQQQAARSEGGRRGG
jgi:hypothetical protein